MTGTRVCGFVDSACWAGPHRRAVVKGGGLQLVVPADRLVVRALDLTGVGRFIPSFGSREESLAAGPAAVSASAGDG
jgi:hypothetical protein